MKAIESYWKDAVAVSLHGTKSRVFVFSISDFPSEAMQDTIRPNERALKMLRIHQLNLFHIRRSLHHIFRCTFVALVIPHKAPPQPCVLTTITIPWHVWGSLVEKPLFASSLNRNNRNKPGTDEEKEAWEAREAREWIKKVKPI